MPQSYSKFDYQDITNLNLDIKTKTLFPEIKPVEPSDLLIMILERNLKKPLGTEKSKSEHIIVPILSELSESNPNIFTYFSGYNFDVDKSKGLKGHCDYLLSTEIDTPIIKAPVISIVEAKHENIEIGIPQCIAQMYASQIFNEKQNHSQKAIYGCVTFGFNWQFLVLENNIAWIDTRLYYLNSLSELLGVWQKVLDFYKN